MSVVCSLVSLRLLSALLTAPLALVFAPPAAASQTAAEAHRDITSGPAQVVPAEIAPDGQPRVPKLIPLFVSYAALQALDVRSTLTVIARGGAEGNALVAPFVNRPAAVIALKAAVTTALLFSAARLSRHNRLAAYGLMFALDSAYAMIVAHNDGVASRLR
jgi:hypothetical protein